MSDLLPCPFCGGEVDQQLMYDGDYSLNCRQCGLSARWADDIARAVPEMIESTEKLWNTRYERTCAPADVDDAVTAKRKTVGDRTWHCICMACRGAVDPRDTFCRHCGRKLVDE